MTFAPLEYIAGTETEDESVSRTLTPDAQRMLEASDRARLAGVPHLDAVELAVLAVQEETETINAAGEKRLIELRLQYRAQLKVAAGEA